MNESERGFSVENVEIQRGGEIVEVVHKEQDQKSTKTTIPFFKNNNLDYADFVGFLGDNAQAVGWIIFVLVTIFVVTAVSNGANLNDGMDGMAAGNSAIIGLTLGILAYVSSHIEYAGYLNIMYIPGSEELVIFICSFIGALIGFLWYNAFPAQVFMGDTGSLTIGGIMYSLYLRLLLLRTQFPRLFFLHGLYLQQHLLYPKQDLDDNRKIVVCIFCYRLGINVVQLPGGVLNYWHDYCIWQHPHWLLYK